MYFFLQFSTFSKFSIHSTHIIIIQSYYIGNSHINRVFSKTKNVQNLHQQFRASLKQFKSLNRFRNLQCGSRTYLLFGFDCNLDQVLIASKPGFRISPQMDFRNHQVYKSIWNRFVLKVFVDETGFKDFCSRNHYLLTIICNYSISFYFIWNSHFPLQFSNNKPSDRTNCLYLAPAY